MAYSKMTNAFKPIRLTDYKRNVGGFESIPNMENGYYLHPDCTYNAMIHTVNAATTSGTELCLWTYTGEPTTQWLIEPTGDPDDSVYIRLCS